ncbi:hypothetical protein BVRB_6g131180 [Beta vulgaris subsp. vulgaris]|nr:hypothetical protein BVRB_6g131180 [Beta vulgaris subsp. vulgaris]
MIINLMFPEVQKQCDLPCSKAMEEQEECSIIKAKKGEKKDTERGTDYGIFCGYLLWIKHFMLLRCL